MSQLKLKGYFQALKPQLIIIGIVSVLQILSFFTLIPAPQQLGIFMFSFLATHGLPLVILASFIENFAGLGTYFPGSIAILSAMALTAGNPTQAVIVYFAIIVPALIANILSYFIGYFSRSQESVLLPNRSTKALFFWYGATYWHPQFAAITAMASGSERIKFWRYFTHFLPISIAWSIFWALLLYNTGKVVLVGSGWFTYIFYGYLIGWLLWGIRKHYRASNLNMVG